MKPFHPLPRSLFVILSWILLLAPTWGEERVALVVGNGKYKNATRLENPINDARAISQLLRGIGFSVTTLENAGVDDFYDGLDAFRRQAENARVGLFYYAGHGLEVEKRNYLLPVDAELDRQSQLRTQAVSLETVLDEMRAARLPAKLLILDCCRNNPLTRSWMKTRSGAMGMATLSDADLPPATMILFAAAPGQEALDGTGRNSPFTDALVSELAQPGRNALDAFYAVSDRVVAATGKRQEPWVKVDGAGRTFRQFDFVKGAAPSKPSQETAAATPMPAKPAEPRAPLTPGLRIVPSQYRTIQSAVNAALSGDVILVKPGVYRELVEVTKDDIEIRGENRDSTILRYPEEFEVNSADLVSVVDAANTHLSNLSLEWPPGAESEDRGEDGVLDELVKLKGGSVTISNCVFQARGEVNGIRIFGGKLVVTGSTFDRCVHGIGYIGSDSFGSVENCKISNTELGGITVQDGARIVVKANTVELSGQNGIMVRDESSYAEIHGNNVLKNGLDGIKFDQGGGGIASGNFCSENQLNGIRADGEGTAPQIENNRCHSNFWHGISIFDSSAPTVRSNHCHKNRYSGITAGGAKTKPAIIDNQAHENGQWGIAVETVCYPSEFKGNSASGNDFGEISRKVTFKKE